MFRSASLLQQQQQLLSATDTWDPLVSVVSISVRIEKETTSNVRVMGIWGILQVFVGWAGGLPSKQLKNNSNVKLFICHVIFFI